MRVEHVSVEPFRIALREPLQTARGPIAHRAGVLFRIICESDIPGVGEAAPLEGFGGASLAETRAALESVAATLPGAELATFHEGSLRELAAAPIARAAVETARLDAIARREGVSLAAKLAARPVGDSVAVNALLHAASPAELAREAARVVADGYTTLKLKLGALSLHRDLARLRAVRDAIPNTVKLRGDANGAWSEREARIALARLAPFGFEYLEQPVPAGALDALAQIRRTSPIPIAADESVRSEADAERVISAGAADVLVLKPAWLGGPAAATRIAARARAAGLEVTITSALDAAVGRAAALHTAVAVGGPFAAGVATGSLLLRDVACLPAPKDGRMWLPEDTGLGVEP